MRKRERIAVIGVGRWGKKIIKTLQTLQGVTVAYTEGYDHRALLGKKDIDAVVVATPASTHAKVALSFIKKGLPVFIEKPLATTIKEAYAIKRAAQKSGSLIFVGHIHIYNPAYLTVKKILQRIGPIRYIFSEGCNNGPYRDDVSALSDWGSHDIYIVLDLLKKYPVSVEGWGMSFLRPRSGLYDTTYTKLNFKNGITAFLFNSWLFPEKRKHITIVGEKSTIVFDEMAQKKVVLYKNMGPIVKNSVVKHAEPVIIHPIYGKTPPLVSELKAFISMIQTRRKPKTDINSGLAVVKILEAAELSIRKKSPVILKNE